MSQIPTLIKNDLFSILNLFWQLFAVNIVIIKVKQTTDFYTLAINRLNKNKYVKGNFYLFSLKWSSNAPSSSTYSYVVVCCFDTTIAIRKYLSRLV